MTTQWDAAASWLREKKKEVTWENLPTQQQRRRQEMGCQAAAAEGE